MRPKGVDSGTDSTAGVSRARRCGSIASARGAFDRPPASSAWLPGRCAAGCARPRSTRASARASPARSARSCGACDARVPSCDEEKEILRKAAAFLRSGDRSAPMRFRLIDEERVAPPRLPSVPRARCEPRGLPRLEEAPALARRREDGASKQRIGGTTRPATAPTACRASTTSCAPRASRQLASASPASCASLASRASRGREGGARRPARLRERGGRRPRTAQLHAPRSSTRSGWPTSPTCPPRRAGSSLRWSSTSAPAHRGLVMRDDLEADIVVDALDGGGHAPACTRPRASLRPRRPVPLAGLRAHAARLGHRRLDGRARRRRTTTPLTE